MDPTIRAIFWLVAIVLAVIASVVGERYPRVAFFPLAFALWVVPWCWDAFEAA